MPTPTSNALNKPPFLSKQRIVARPNFNRWLVPPAALAIHLCIGMAYGFSVFWLPLSKAIGIDHPIECAADIGFFNNYLPHPVIGKFLHLAGCIPYFLYYLVAQQPFGADG